MTSAENNVNQSFCFDPAAPTDPTEHAGRFRFWWPHSKITRLRCPLSPSPRLYAGSKRDSSTMANARFRSLLYFAVMVSVALPNPL